MQISVHVRAYVVVVTNTVADVVSCSNDEEAKRWCQRDCGMTFLRQ